MKTIKDYVNENSISLNALLINIDESKLVSQGIIHAIRFAIKNGYLIQDNVKYGISRENIYNLSIDSDAIDNEDLEKIIKKAENDGIKFKFEKDDEWKKAGYHDPNEDVEEVVDTMTKPSNSKPNENIIHAIKFGMRTGYIVQNGVKYGISKENIFTISHDSMIDIEKIVMQLEKDGQKWKFEKDDEWKKAGYKDPNEE